MSEGSLLMTWGRFSALTVQWPLLAFDRPSENHCLRPSVLAVLFHLVMQTNDRKTIWYEGVIFVGKSPGSGIRRLRLQCCFYPSSYVDLASCPPGTLLSLSVAWVCLFPRPRRGQVPVPVTVEY